MKKPVFTAFFLVLAIITQSCSSPNGSDSNNSNIHNIVNFTEIEWVSTSLFYDSVAQKKPLSIIYFTDDVCSDGVLMEDSTFLDSAIIVALNSSYNFARVSTANDSLIQFQNTMITGNAFFKQYNLVGVPSLLIFDSENKRLGRIQAGYYPTDTFLVLLNYYIDNL